MDMPEWNCQFQEHILADPNKRTKPKNGVKNRHSKSQQLSNNSLEKN